MYEKGEYVIRVLPAPDIAIKRDYKTYDSWKIKGYTFSTIPLKLKIRPKAAYFAKQKFLSGKASQTYVVLYFTEEKMECLYAFRFYNTNSGKTLSICRCVGSMKSKKHWQHIQKIIEDNKDKILELKEMEIIKAIPVNF